MKNKTKESKRYAIIISILLGIVAVIIGNLCSLQFISILNEIVGVETDSNYIQVRDIVAYVLLNLSMMVICILGGYAIWRPKKNRKTKKYWPKSTYY